VCEGFGGGFGFERVGVGKLPVNVAAVVGSGLNGEVEDCGGAVGREADGPGLLGAVFAGGFFGGREGLVLVGLGFVDGLGDALNLNSEVPFSISGKT
jgi:hypothetical protein